MVWIVKQIVGYFTDILVLWSMMLGTIGGFMRSRQFRRENRQRDLHKQIMFEFGRWV